MSPLVTRAKKIGDGVLAAPSGAIQKHYNHKILLNLGVVFMYVGRKAPGTFSGGRWMEQSCNGLVYAKYSIWVPINPFEWGGEAVRPSGYERLK